jgi:hypothetical protein
VRLRRVLHCNSSEKNERNSRVSVTLMMQKLSYLQNQQVAAGNGKRSNGMPVDEVCREALEVEPPVVAVVSSADLTGDRTRGEAGLNDAVRADQALPCKSVDLQRVPHVGMQELEDWVHCTHSPMRCQDEWFHYSMCPQPVSIHHRARTSGFILFRND